MPKAPFAFTFILLSLHDAHLGNNMEVVKQIHTIMLEIAPSIENQTGTLYI